MHRRAVLAGLASGTGVVAGCTGRLFRANTPPDVSNPSGQAVIRPLDTPYIRAGISSEAEHYFDAWLFRAGDFFPATDAAAAGDFADTVAALSTAQFAVLTNLRTAAAAPAYLWPTETTWRGGRLQLTLTRQPRGPIEAPAEAVGVTITVFDVDGEPPGGAELILPSGATFTVGTPD